MKNSQFLAIWLFLIGIFAELIYLNHQVYQSAQTAPVQPASVTSLVTPSPPVTHPLFSAKQRYAHDGTGQHYNIYTGNDARHWTQLRLTRQGNVYLPRFTVSALDVEGWNFPCIGQGANHGMVPSPSLGRKTWYPVRANHDGDPYATLTDHLTWKGNWQAGFDAWFEPRYDARGQFQQYGGTELMILTAVSRHGHPVSRGLPGHPRGSVYADGHWWNVSTGMASAHGVKSWHRIYVVARKPLTSFSGPLNPFLRVAEHFGALNGRHYLTGLEYGFEINSGGTGLAVNSYNLHGVANATARHLAYGPPAVYRVPRVTGLRQATAVQRLRSAGWGVRLVTPYVRSRVLVVSAQSPHAGTAFYRKVRVTIRSRVRR